MNKDLCLKKENGVTTEISRANYVDHTCTFTLKDNCFSKIFDPKAYDKSLKNYIGAAKYASKISAEDERLSRKVIDALNTARNITQLENICKDILLYSLEVSDKEVESQKKEYVTINYQQAVNTKNKLDDLYEFVSLEKNDTSMTVVSMVIKQFISCYYTNMIKGLEHEDYIAVLYAKEKNDTDLILKLLNIKNINSQYKEFAINIIKEAIEIKFDSLGTHLCWEHCKNTLNCEKIAHQIKKTIDKYDFIKSGYQEFNSKGEVEVFKVTECDNYVKNPKTQQTKEDREALRKLKEDLFLIAYNAETVEEARRNKGKGFYNKLFN